MRGDHIRSPEQVDAHREVELAIRDKRLRKQPCVVCACLGIFQPKVDAHHVDYTRPLLVIWLCRKHHRQYHAFEDKRVRGETLQPETTTRHAHGANVVERLQHEGGNLPHPTDSQTKAILLDLHGV